MKNVDYGFFNYDELTVIGPYILIEKMTKIEHKAGEIIIPDSKEYQNNKIGVGKILEIGKKAKIETNLNPGDYVLYDYYAANGNSGKNVLLKYNNVILQLTEDEMHQYLNSNLL